MASMQEYLKRYTDDADKKKKKKKKKPKALNGCALTIVDADPVWQKDVKDESSESEPEKEDAPLVIEDVEFKRMQRLEALRMRPYLATAEDGSGWVSLNDDQNPGLEAMLTGLKEPISEDGMDTDFSSPLQKNEKPPFSPRKERDLSPPRKEKDLSPPRKGRHDFPEPREDTSPPQKGSRRDRHDSSDSGAPSQDLSLSRKALRRGSPPSQDLSPPRKPSVRVRHDSPTFNTSREMSPPRRRLGRGRQDSPELNTRSADLSPPRRMSKRDRHDSPESDFVGRDNAADLSPPRKGSRSSKISDMRDAASNRNGDSSPPRRHLRRVRQDSPEPMSLQTVKSPDLSPPRRGQLQDYKDDKDLSPARRKRDDSGAKDFSRIKKKEVMGGGTSTGLQSGRVLAKEITMKKKSDSQRVKELDVTISGRNATTVYRDKHGKRLEGVDEILKLQQVEEPKKEEKPLEWGKGLVQKREAELRHVELEAERTKPFARTRDDLDAMLKEQIRWGDPMAHLVKKKVVEPVLVDLGANEQMKESGFIVPQEVPSHSWLKRGIAPPPNRYGIKPGRHWDGVDRSTGFERDMYRRQNEKKAEQEEAYLWSVADM